jgi:hypothetical protein
MNRYFYYLVVTNMLVNVLALVPRVLINERFNGAVWALPISAVIGFVVMVAFVRTLGKFPQKGLPEILDTIMPVWLRNVLLAAFALNWYFSGCLTIVGLSEFTRKFLNPEITKVSVVGLYLAISVYMARMKSNQILNMLEIIVLLVLPLNLFILVKTIFHPHMSWDAVRAVGMFYNHPPSVKSIAANTYVYSGYISMVVFNRVIPHFRPKGLWGIVLFGLFISFTTMFIPIGYQGADGVGDFTFPWMSTADSMRIELGFIERVMFVYMFLYGQIAFAGIIVHWHVAFECFKSVSAQKGEPLKWANSKYFPWIVMAFFAAGAVGGSMMNNKQMFDVGELWVEVRMFVDLLLVIVIMLASGRVNRHAKPA